MDPVVQTAKFHGWEMMMDEKCDGLDCKKAPWKQCDFVMSACGTVEGCGKKFCLDHMKINKKRGSPKELESYGCFQCNKKFIKQKQSASCCKCTCCYLYCCFTVALVIAAVFIV